MTTSTQTIADFLLARIAEDEGNARYVQGSNPWTMGLGPCTRQWWMLRLLADCEAKRRIVNHCVTAIKRETPGADARESWILQLLAQAYNGHPDFREEWALW